MVQQQSSSASSSVRTLPPVATKTPQGPEGAKNKPAAKKNGPPSSTPFWLGLLISIAWTGLVMLIVAKSGPAHTFGGLPLINWALGISAVVSPLALVWMITAYLQRATDIQSIAEPLRRQLLLVTGESGAAEVRIRRFNQAIREQIELLRSTQNGTQGDLNAVMDRVRQHRNELERFEHASIHQVKEIQEVIRRNMQHIEQLMDDKFTMMRVLDDKLVQNGTSVSRQMETVREQVESMLKEIEHCSSHVAGSLDKAMHDSKKLADIALAQESSLSAAASSAADTLGSVSSKIDLSVARFLERAGTAREEAERLAVALDTQTRSLDEFSNILPSRVGEAESILRGVADRLYASEQLAREQAVNLSDKLSQQVDGLQSFMDRFTERLTDVDSRLQQRSQDLQGLTERVSGSTEDFVASWEKSVTDLSDRTNTSLLRFTVMNDETRRNADVINDQLTSTTRQYEDAALRMHSLSTESHTALKSMTEDIVTHLTQFETLRVASHQAGEEVQARAASAMHNLQFVLERLLAAREATQSVGSTLVKDLHSAVEQNEQMITRLNEAAQMSVRALGIATESLGKQQGEFAGQTRSAEAMLQEAASQLQSQAQVAEKGLREQATGLLGLLAEVQVQMNSTDQKLKGFTSQSVTPIHQALQHIDNSTAKGLDAMGRYGEGLQEQLNRLQQFNGRVSDMGGELSRVTIETLSGIENLNTRFIAARTAQEDTARQTLAQFTDLSERLQREISGLDSQSAQAVSTLQQAAARVGEQSYQMLQDAQNSGAQMHTITSALQNEASQIRSILQKQADDLSADLSRAEVQFSALGEGLRQRTDSAYALLDRVATHYNEVTRTAAQDLETRTERLEQATGQANSKVEALNSILAQQLSLIGNGSNQLEAHAAQIGTVTGKTLQNLSALNEKLSITHEAANSNAQQTIARLEETNTAFMRQSNSLSEAAQNSVTLIQRTGAAFGDQSGKLMDISQSIDQHLRQLTAVTSSLADQSTQIRANMEQQNQRLIATLTETVTQLDSTSNKLQQSVSVAATGADQVSARFTEMTQSASNRLTSTQREMQTVADRAEGALTSLSTNITQQSASMAVLSEQLVEQQRVMSVSNEGQRTQLVDLFDKLGSAHGEASSLAERTITRLTEALNQIQRHLGALSDQSQTTVGNIRTATTGFVDQSGVLLQNAQAAEQQARTVLSVTSALQDQSRQLRESLHNESERTHDILTTLLGKISSGGAEIRDVGNNTEMALTSLQNTLSQQSTSLNSTVGQISERQRSLTIALDAQRDVINGLLNRLALAQDETAAHAERAVVRLTEGAQKVERQVETLDARAQNALATIQGSAAGFAQEITTLSEQAQTTEQQARSMTSAAIALQEQSRQLHNALHSESERINDVLSALFSKLASGNIQLQDTGKAAEATLNQLSGRFSNESSNVKDTIQNVMERQRDLTGALTEQREILDNILSRITTAQNETASTAERTVNRLADGAQQLTKQLENIGVQAQSTLANVQNANSSFAQQVVVLTDRSQQAEQQANSMTSAAIALQEQSRQLHNALYSESERTNEALNALLNKLASGSTQLQDTGRIAETTLSQLSDRFGGEANNIKDTIHGVMERQRNLTAALSEQREILDNLLSRITTAQDETASTAERTVARLADGTQQMTKQLETFGAQAQSTLSNVQSANSGFAAEAGALNLHAQQAEQQMRGVLSVTAGMQEQARQLRESMQGETAHVVEQMTKIISQLDVTSNHMKQNSGSAIQSMDQTVTQFTALTKTSSDNLQKQVEALATTADQTESRLDRAGDKIRSHLKLIDDVAGEAEQKARQLADTAGYATSSLVTLRDSLVESDKESQTTMVSFAQRIEDVKATLQNELYRLAELSQQAVQQINIASQQLTSNSDDLRTNVGNSEIALISAAAAVRNESEHVPATLSRSVSAFEKASRDLKDQAQASEGVLVGTADRFISVTTTARESMAEEMRRISLVADNAGQILSQFNLALSEQVAAMQQHTTALSGEQKELVEKATDSISQLVEANDRLTQLRQNASQTAEKLAANLNELDQRATASSQRLTTTNDVVIKNMDALTQATQRAESQMLGASNDFREQLERIRAGVQGQIDDINRGLMQITAQLERTGSTLRNTTSGTLADVERISQRFDSTNKEASEQLTEKTVRMRSTTEEVAQLLSGFGDQLDTLLGRLSMASDGVRRHEGDIVTQLQSALSHLSTVTERLEDGRVLTTNVSEQAVDRLNTVAEAIQQQMQNLTTGSQTAAGVMRGIGQIYGDQSEKMNRSVTDSYSQLQSMNKSIDDMQARTDRMRVSLKLQGEELMNSLQQILTQLSLTGDSLSDTVDTVLQEQAAKNLQKIS